jgi:hypothetical protein
MLTYLHKVCKLLDELRIKELRVELSMALAKSRSDENRCQKRGTITALL